MGLRPLSSFTLMLHMSARAVSASTPATEDPPPLAVGGTAEIYALDDSLVVKLYWRGAGLGAAEREALAARVAHAVGAPTPVVVDVVSAGERFGVVFERVHGDSMLDAMRAEPDGAQRHIRTLARLHADLHGRGGATLPPQRDHLSRRISLSPLNHRVRSTVLAALASLPGGESLCHGDFHPGNVLLVDNEPSIIDWFDAVCGNPAGDVARTLLLLQYARAPGDNTFERARSALASAYLDEYRKVRELPSDALQAWILPVAAARLAEPIASQERAALIRLIEGMLAGTLPVDVAE